MGLRFRFSGGSNATRRRLTRLTSKYHRAVKNISPLVSSYWNGAWQPFSAWQSRYETVGERHNVEKFYRLDSPVALTAALVTMPAATAHAQGNKNTNRLLVPIAGTAAGVGKVAGNFAISNFAITNGTLVAVGSLTATVPTQQVTSSGRS